MNGFSWSLGQLTCVEFSPDGACLASGDSEKREIIVWSTSDWTVRVEGQSDSLSVYVGSLSFPHLMPQSGWCFHTARVNSLAWTSDSQKLASGSLDQDIFIWSLQQPSKRIHISRK